jgi:tRNA modification GTPase
MREDLADTICAIATAAGEGGIGIVRLSGTDALHVAERVVRLRSGKSLASMASHTLHLADLVLPTTNGGSGDNGPDRTVDTFFDEAFVVYMKAPRSFTAEDVVEVHSHGGPVVLALLCEACVRAGARMAAPGEFTKRAFLNGRLDLSQAEAVLDTIRAKSAIGLRMAQRHLRGELAREVDGARSLLLGVLAHVEASIDFVEEDISFVQREELERVIEKATTVIKQLESTARDGRVLREGARVVIVGRPNVGKSSLMNRLLKQDRAIVTPLPGTTRDVIEESIDLDGVVVRFVDTAGIRESTDPIEREGIKRTQSAQADADLVLVVIDGHAHLTNEDRQLLKTIADSSCLIVVNKEDLPRAVDITELPSGAEVLVVSAKTGAGLEKLKVAIRARLVSPGFEVSESLVVTNVRHRTALRRAQDSLAHASESVRNGLAWELVAMDLRVAADTLGEITGMITTDDILERIFSEFCIGK